MESPCLVLNDLFHLRCAWVQQYGNRLEVGIRIVRGEMMSGYQPTAVAIIVSSSMCAGLPNCLNTNGMKGKHYIPNMFGPNTQRIIKRKIGVAP